MQIQSDNNSGQDDVRRLLKMMPMDTYPDAACDVIGAIKAERRRWLELLDEIERKAGFDTVAEVIAWLRKAGENGERA